jgi:hypothetical protein
MSDNSKIELTFELNSFQLEHFEEMLKTLKWCHYANIIVRKDGQDFSFEADWLYNMNANKVEE